jgi:uncharacterized membrane protein YeaQ/YmgE (transglycosylase-associated protein family)
MDSELRRVFYPSSMEFITLLFIGLIAGLLANRFLGGSGYGIVRDVGLGILGALSTTWLVGASGLRASSGRIDGTIVIGFIGAVVLVVLVRVIRHGRRTRDLWTRPASSSAPWRP